MIALIGDRSQFEDWIEKGIAGKSIKREYPGKGSVTLWSHAQLHLFLKALEQRQHYHVKISHLCNLPVWAWVYFGETMEVPLSQVCKSQDSAGEIGTVLWAGKRSLQDGLSAGDSPQNYTTFSRRILGFTRMLCEARGWNYQRWRGVDKADFDAMYLWSLEMKLPDEELLAMQRRCQQQAQDILTLHWEAVETLAAALLERDRLRGTEAHAMIRQALDETEADWRTESGRIMSESEEEWCKSGK